MCGLTGYLTPPSSWTSQSLDVLNRMTDVLQHRGPDSRGVWHDAQRGIALGHRRLSIQDLSAAGHQPMASICGRYVVVFNGEIYNYKVLRAELEQQTPHVWRGHSDTEVLLAAIALWGVQATLCRCVGMFALALWDRQEQALCLARDRMGEKPLYVGWCGDTLLFGSELKALRQHPAWRGQIDRAALTLLIRHGFIPAPHSIYQGIRKLRPGTLVWVRPGQREWDETVYWSVAQAALQGLAHPFTGSEAEAVQAFEAQLREAIAIQQVADVPLGAFLSGGIDSTTVVALMQSQSQRPVRTFTIGFHEREYDEAVHARAVAEHLGTQHTTLYVTPNDALAVIPKLPEIYDEPFADPSQIPTFLVSQLTRAHVSVALSGDGGDELFVGYPRYFWTEQIWRRARYGPALLRRAVARLVQAIPPHVLSLLLQGLGSRVPAHVRSHERGDKLHKLMDLLACRDDLSLYRRLQAPFKDNVVLGAQSIELGGAADVHALWNALPDMYGRMTAFDMLTYLPDDILAKVDRASMAVSLETRLPLLDYRVIELAWRIPQTLKVQHRQGKWLLRQLLYRYVPQRLMERPKMGFSIPLADWLRGPLRGWAESLLDASGLAAEGFLNVPTVCRYWQEHLTGVRNWQYALWNVLMFQAWLRSEQGHLST